MVTGRFDISSIEDNRELGEKCKGESVRIAPIQACHIFNESMVRAICGESAVWSNVRGHCVLTPLSPPSPTPILRVVSLLLLWSFSSALDLPTNTLWWMVFMALGIFSHLRPKCISSLADWACGLKPPKRYVIIRRLSGMVVTSTQPDCYSVCTLHESVKEDLVLDGYLRRDGDRLIVTFPSRDTGAHPPDANLLSIHAMCARVAHKSGAAKIVDESDQDVNDTEVPAFDGSSAHLLDHPATVLRKLVSSIFSPFLVV